MGRRQENREELHNLLLGLTENVYYEPPASMLIAYPCIVYTREAITTRYADDKTYSNLTQYQITYISRTPDDDVLDEILSTFQMIRHSRHYVSENLHHDVFYLYY